MFVAAKANETQEQQRDLSGLPVINSGAFNEIPISIMARPCSTDVKSCFLRGLFKNTFNHSHINRFKLSLETIEISYVSKFALTLQPFIIMNTQKYPNFSLMLV